MTNLTKLFEYEGNKVTFKTVEGVVYVNATQMSAPFGKKPAAYLRLQSSVELIEACVLKSHTSINQYIIVKMGSPENGGGTWLHEDIAIDFAQWLSIGFRLWCNDRLKELLNSGSTSIVTKTFSTKELLTMNLEALEKNEALEKQLAIQQPRMDYIAKVLKSDSYITINTIALELGMTHQKLNKLLEAKGIQYERGKRWFLWAKYRELGYAYNTTETKNGHTYTYMVWTERGRAFIHSILNPIMVKSIATKQENINQLRIGNHG